MAHVNLQVDPSNRPRMSFCLYFFIIIFFSRLLIFYLENEQRKWLAAGIRNLEQTSESAKFAHEGRGKRRDCDSKTPSSLFETWLEPLIYKPFWVLIFLFTIWKKKKEKKPCFMRWRTPGIKLNKLVIQQLSFGLIWL